MKKTNVYLPESNVPMYDLGSLDSALSGIFTVGYDEKTISAYMTDYYSSEASVEGQAYDLVDMYKDVFSLTLTQIKPKHFETALELGAGFGSGTYAMAQLYPNMKIIASELSTQMLLKHKRTGTKYPTCEKQITRCQINADKLIFNDNCFDLVFGTATLHHVFNPKGIIKDIGRVLKPGGVAIFTEPFEPGYGLLRLAYTLILKQHQEGLLSLTNTQHNYLCSALDYWAYINVDNARTTDELKNMDDKWIFPYSFFDEVAELAGFDFVHKMPIVQISEEKCHIENIYKTHTQGNNIELPDSALELVRLIDKCFSKQQLESMPHDGVLILQKSKTNCTEAQDCEERVNTVNSEIKPLVSIIIPVYNGSNYLREAIDSALAQTYSNVEIIVVNDGSIDESEEIVKSYGSKIKYYSKTNGGVATALNMGIKNMQGEYFSWLSHDDLYAPDKIEKNINALKHNSKSIVYSDYDGIDENGNYTGTGSVRNVRRSNNFEFGLYPIICGQLHCCSLLIHRSHFEKHGLFNEELKTTQDYDLFFKMLRGQQLVYIPESLVMGRTHSGQTTHISDRTIMECDALWISMLSSLTLEEMCQICGSEFQFWVDQVLFMKEFTPYRNATDYAFEQLKNCNIKLKDLSQKYSSQLSEMCINSDLQLYSKFSLLLAELTDEYDRKFNAFTTSIANENSSHIIATPQLGKAPIKSRILKSLFHRLWLISVKLRINEPIKRTKLYKYMQKKGVFQRLKS